MYFEKVDKGSLDLVDLLLQDYYEAKISFVFKYPDCKVFTAFFD